MTLSVPSFLAAATRASIPPSAWADVAEAALSPEVEELPDFAGGEQAAIPMAARAATTATPVGRAMVFTSASWGDIRRSAREAPCRGGLLRTLTTTGKRIMSCQRRSGHSPEGGTRMVG